MDNKKINKNILGLNIKEDEYRALDYPSYSLFSSIAKDGIAVLEGIKSEDISELDGIMVGKLVDSLYIDNVYPENMHIIDKKPSGKAKVILKVIADSLEYLPNKDKIFDKANIDLLNKICSKIGYYKSSVKYGKDENHPSLIKKRMAGLMNYKEYLDLICKIKDHDNAFIISRYLYDTSLKVVKELNKIKDLKTIPGKVEVQTQVKLVEEIEGISIKGMLDFIIIDHDKKEIIPFDLKTGYYLASEFIDKGYIGWNYYIQSSLYFKLLEKAMKAHPIYKDYKLNSFKFIYCSRGSKKEVAIFNVSIETLATSFLTDFYCKEYTRKSTISIINEYVKYMNRPF